MPDYNFFRNYPKSTPRPAHGGIKAQSRRGAFGQSWWAQRWIHGLERFCTESRLERGRYYARRGQVLKLQIEPGQVGAKVQGSRPGAYAVDIRFSTFSEAEIARLQEALSHQVLYTAKLLAGEMPQDIESVFEAAGLSLFPRQNTDLDIECTCLDWEAPCKHVAAVYYLLGEEFDRDPFLLFTLRGIERARLLSGLLHSRAEPMSGEGATWRADADPLGTETEPATPAFAGAAEAAWGDSLWAAVADSQPLSSDENEFWHGGNLPAIALSEPLTPPLNAALPRSLGQLPFWRGERSMIVGLDPLYARATRRALKLLQEG